MEWWFTPIEGWEKALFIIALLIVVILIVSFTGGE